MELYAHSESIYRIYNRAGTPGINAYMHDVLYTSGMSHQTVTAATAFTILLDTIWSIDSIELYFRFGILWQLSPASTIKTNI